MFISKHMLVTVICSYKKILTITIEISCARIENVSLNRTLFAYVSHRCKNCYQRHEPYCPSKKETFLTN